MIRQCMSLRHPVYKEIPRSRIFGLFVSRALGRVDELAAGPHGLQIQRASSVVASQQNVGLLPLLERANARAAHTWPHKYLGSHRLLSTHRRSDRSNDNWELTVGIEVHAQLNTDLKLFSSATTAFVGQPNEHVSVFDAAIPGSQPVFQQATLIPALRAALALNCEIARESRFDRKHYFYQDQPAGYQITQYYKPFARGGFLTLTRDDGIDPSDGDEVTVGIKQVQLEQDTAKTTQEGSSIYLLDFNRVSHPLIEIISLPDIHHPATAAAFVRKIQSTLSSMNAAIIGMEFGGLRADVNVSIKRKASHDAFRSDLPETGRVGLGQRTEIKNLSSFKAIEDAIRAERNRQIDIIEAGGVIKGETRGWTLGSTETERLRGKEGEVDYRYMPDPDLPPLRICESLITGLKSNMPTSVENIVAALTTSKQYGLSKRDAKTLAASENAARLNYYVQVVNELTELAVEAGHTKPIDPYFGSGRIVGNWVIHELGGLMNNSNLHWDPEMSVPSSAMAELINLVLGKDITGQTAKKLLTIIFCGDRRAPKKIVEDENLWFHPLSEEDYKNLAKTVIRNNQGIVKAILRKGETGRVKFLVGQVMHFGEKGRVEAPKAEAAIRQMINALL